MAAGLSISEYIRRALTHRKITIKEEIEMCIRDRRMRGHAEILGCVDLNEQPIPEGQRYEIFICLNAYHFVQQKIPCYSAHNILNNVFAVQDLSLIHI